jgi:hypothetical protein
VPAAGFVPGKSVLFQIARFVVPAEPAMETAGVLPTRYSLVGAASAFGAAPMIDAANRRREHSALKKLPLTDVLKTVFIFHLWSSLSVSRYF